MLVEKQILICIQIMCSFVFILMSLLSIMSHRNDMFFICLSPLLYKNAHCCSHAHYSYFLIDIIFSVFSITSHIYILTVGQDSRRKLTKIDTHKTLVIKIFMVNVSSVVICLCTSYSIEMYRADRANRRLFQTRYMFYLCPCLLYLTH